MKEIKISGKREVKENLEIWLKNNKSFILKKDDKEVTVKISKDNYVEISPNPTSYRWDYKYIKEYSSEITSAIIKTLIVNENVVYLGKTYCQGNDESWLFDKRNNKVFYFSNGKLYRERQDATWLENAKDKLHIDRPIIDENYQLTEKDLKAIENTDVHPDYLKRVIIEHFKGQYATSNIGQQALQRIYSYNYKFFFTCEECGKKAFHWRSHTPLCLPTYRGPYYCSDCEPYMKAKRNREIKKEIEERQAHPTNTLNMGGIKLHTIPMPSLIPAKEIKTVWGKSDDVGIKLSDLVSNALPMDKPSDSLLYCKPVMNRTKGES